MRALRDHDAAFMVIGGLGAQLLGASVTTMDVDVCYQRDRQNHERLVAALKDIHARLRIAGVDEELPFLLDAETIQAGGSFTFVTDAGALSVVAQPWATKGFDDLVQRAVDVDLGGGLVVKVAALEDLIRMKEASRRPKDQAHLLVLRALEQVLAEES